VTTLAEFIDWLWDDAYAAGQLAERHRIAEAYAELEAAWRPVGRKSHAQRVAERVAEMEQHAARMAERLGRPAGYVYRGGPVDWETGRPVQRLGVAA